jgi:hypothetical protein
MPKLLGPDLLVLKLLLPKLLVLTWLDLLFVVQARCRWQQTISIGPYKCGQKQPALLEPIEDEHRFRVTIKRDLTASLNTGSPIMLRRVLASSRYILFIAVIAALLVSVALILYEAIVIAEVIFNAAVLFLRETVERAKDPDLLRLAAALAIMIAALVFFLSLRENRKAARILFSLSPNPQPLVSRRERGKFLKEPRECF